MDEKDFSHEFDVIENDYSYIVMIDLPGMERENIKVTYKDNFLTISGEKFKDMQGLIISGRHVGKFSAQIEIKNMHNDNESMSALYRDDGVLVVTFMKFRSNSANLRVCENIYVL